MIRPSVLFLAIFAFVGCSSSSSDPAPIPEPEPDPPAQWITVDIAVVGDLPLYFRYRPQFSLDWELLSETELAPGDHDFLLLPFLPTGYEFQYWNGDTGKRGTEIVADDTGYESCPTCCDANDPCPFAIEVGFLLP